MNGDDVRWTSRALRLLEPDQGAADETPLVQVRLPAMPDVDIYLKDESVHRTGSLKHRLARSLLLHGLCSGRIGPRTPVVEASSGSTAVSVAYFAHELRLPFHAVMPSTTSVRKIEAITAYGGVCHLVERGDQIYARAEALAAAKGGLYLDQFTYAERVSDWRRDNVAAALFEQMRGQRHPVPRWIVMSLGTGGTAATIGRFIRYRGHPTSLCAVDVEHSAYFECFEGGDRAVRCELPSRIEGVGRPRVEPSFVPEVIDEMIKAPDAASIAAMRILSERLGRRVGPSTGANFLGVCRIAERMRDEGKAGSVASLICDGGDRYADSYYNQAWLAARGLEIAGREQELRRLIG
ncbi:MAG TPA: PLP-dependent cysteine synthase family protein [Caulobacteraceae bacterium]|jgi:cysteine synthase A